MGKTFKTSVPIIRDSDPGSEELREPSDPEKFITLCVSTEVRRLLDVGYSAGILSLAAAALGVPQVVGVDLAWPGRRR